MLSIACVVALGTAACGAGDGIPGDAVARVGEVSITRAALGHWMHVALGEDYLALMGGSAPTALLAPPPASASCVAYLRSIASKRADGGGVEALAQLRDTCARLYRAIREQALRSLIYAAWDEGQAAEQHVSVSEAEVRRQLARARGEQGAASTSLAAYLGERALSLSDALSIAKDELLLARVQAKLGRSLLGRLTA